MFVAETVPLDGLIVAFQALVTVWPPASVKVSFQPLIALLPVFVTVTLFVSPVFHALTWLVTLHAPAEPVLDAEGDADGDAEADGDGEVLAEGEGEALGEGLPVLPLPSRPKKWTATAAIPLCGRA